jgi:hypothetical protein
MLFLVEIDQVTTGVSLTTPEAGCAFIEQVIFPSPSRGEQMVGGKKIVGGWVVGTYYPAIYRCG